MTVNTNQQEESQVKQHFVRFYSPGTFVAETSDREIEEWDVDTAMEMARSVKERYGATPYGFNFSTRERGPEDLDSHVTETSPMYYLGGTILTLAEIEARHDPRDAILISNMKYNQWDRVVQNDNSWR